ncbi:MAG TPA: ABC transporter permease [Actinopolymorphaceae bacterium]|jgi:peptide/nickel transport system permease protein
MADPTLLELSAQGPSATSAAPALRGKSPTRIALERLRSDKIALVCLAVVVFFVLVAIFADLITRLTNTDLAFNIELVDDRTNLPTVGASLEHPFGLEPRTGRDLFAMWVLGARYTMLVALGAACISTILGSVLGLVAGFLGGWVDRVICWVIDFLLSLPFLLLAIAIAPVIATYLQDASSETQSQIRLVTLVAILAVFGWTTLARLIRGEVLSLREREFVLAARAIGVPTRQILFRELLPNLTGPIIVSLSLSFPAYITAEAGLSFLGVGLIEPMPSWGRTIALARNYYSTYPEYLWQPVLAILVLVLALNLLGDAVRDAFDPKTRR